MICCLLVLVVFNVIKLITMETKAGEQANVQLINIMENAKITNEACENDKEINVDFTQQSIDENVSLKEIKLKEYVEVSQPVVVENGDKLVTKIIDSADSNINESSETSCETASVSTGLIKEQCSLNVDVESEDNIESNHEVRDALVEHKHMISERSMVPEEVGTVYYSTNKIYFEHLSECLETNQRESSDSSINNDVMKNENDEEMIKFQEPSDEFPPTFQRFHGYKFDENFILRDMNGQQFEYNFYEQDILNQKRYNIIGEAINQYIYELLLSKYKMHQHFIPFDASNAEPQGFFFASENAEITEDKLLILIHGSGVVRAGQWARRIIINDNLMDGSQIPYIEQAYREGYEVVLLNTNQNKIENKYIRGSNSPEEHALYVWDNFIMNKVKAKHIAIMAHSYGGCVTLSMANERTIPFLERVFAVGFSDSVHSMGFNTKQTVRNFFEKHGKNWVTSMDDLDVEQPSLMYLGANAPKVSAGHIKHEWTSATCMNSVFKFFGENLINHENCKVKTSSSANKWLKFKTFIKSKLKIRSKDSSVDPQVDDNTLDSTKGDNIMNLSSSLDNDENKQEDDNNVTIDKSCPRGPDSLYPGDLKLQGAMHENNNAWIANPQGSDVDVLKPNEECVTETNSLIHKPISMEAEKHVDEISEVENSGKKSESTKDLNV